MNPSKFAALALAISSVSAVAQAEEASQDFFPISLKTVSAQSEAPGFLEGQSLAGTTRNWFANEDQKRNGEFRYRKSDGTIATKSSRDTWVQGTVLNYSSGFTQGTVGIATEVAAYNVIALQQGRARTAAPNNRTLGDSDGNVVDQWSKLGLANIKARVSNTVFTAGRMNMDTPMVATIGNRALPSSFEGFNVTSEEFDNLTFQAAGFDRVSPRTEQGLSKFRSEYGDLGTETDNVVLAGVGYKPFKSLTTSLYASRVKDFWNQYYFGAVHEWGDSNVFGLTTGLNYYKTVDTGQKKMGNIDNDTYSLSLTGTHKAHSVTLAYQQVNGNEYFDYLHETNGIFLANSLFSDFNGPNEKSAQVAYALNMAEYGVPGLKFNVYTARGWGIDGTHYRGTAYAVNNQDGEHHYEYGVGTTYTLQSGPLKSTSVRATYSTHRASENQGDGNLNELRIVTTIPFTIL